MLKNYFAVAVRNLRKEKSYAIINVVGVAIGLTICLLVMAYVIDEYSFDSFHADSDRIYRLIQRSGADGTDLYAGTPFPVRPMLLENVPSIETVAQFTSTEDVIVTANGENFREEINFADPEFFEVFSFRLISGDAKSALSRPGSIVLTESAAQRLLGSVDVLGRELVVTTSGKKYTYFVSAVAEDSPANSSLQYKLITQTAEIKKFLDFELGWNLTAAETYLRIRPDADPGRVIADIQAAANVVPKKAGSESTWTFMLQPLADIHLNPQVSGDTPTSSPTYSLLLGAIGFIVLVLACINFTTLAIGRSQRRIREIGVRKVMGASDSQLYGQLLSEAFVVSLLALLLAFVMAELALPTFNNLSGKAISSILLTTGGWSLAIVALVLLTALLAGGYPAVILSKAPTVQAVRGTARMLSGGTLTRVLVALQFTLSAALIVITLTMSSQLAYMRSAPLGFNKEELVMLQLRGASGEEKLAIIERLRNALHENDGVLSVCASGTSFTGGGMRNTSPAGPDSIDFTVFLNTVDHDYLTTMGLELIRGNPFRPGASPAHDQIIVNETFTKTLGWDSPIGQSVPGLDGVEIIGEIKDYHIRSLAREIEPIALLQVQPGNEWAGQVRFAFLRTSPNNIPATMKRIQEVWSQVAPNLPYSYEFMDQHIAAQYRSYEKWENIMKSAASLAVVVACFGVFGLTALAIARRRKELGIRKVLGARSSQLVALLNREFMILVVLGNLIAWPVAYYSVNRWLADFAYRESVSPWPFIFGISLLLGIVIITVSIQALRAAMLNPTDAIRCE